MICTATIFGYMHETCCVSYLLVLSRVTLDKAIEICYIKVLSLYKAKNLVMFELAVCSVTACQLHSFARMFMIMPMADLDQVFLPAGQAYTSISSIMLQITLS